MFLEPILAYVLSFALVHYILFYQICPKFQQVWHLALGKWKFVVSMLLAFVMPVTLTALCIFIFGLFVVGMMNDEQSTDKIKV